jgi:hypothetical protein
MTQPVTPQQDHELYRRDIDAAHSMTALAVAKLQTDIRMRKRVHKALFLVFYENFVHLFALTSTIKELRDSNPDLMDRINVWIRSRHPVEHVAEEGIDLFQRWSCELQDRGVHSLRK